MRSYIAADADLLRCDADDSLDHGRAWGGASAGDIVGAANVCVCVCVCSPSVSCNSHVALVAQVCSKVQMGHTCKAGHLCKDRHNKVRPPLHQHFDVKHVMRQSIFM